MELPAPSAWSMSVGRKSVRACHRNSAAVNSLLRRQLLALAVMSLDVLAFAGVI